MNFIDIYNFGLPSVLIAMYLYALHCQKEKWMILPILFSLPFAFYLMYSSLLYVVVLGLSIPTGLVYGFIQTRKKSRFKAYLSLIPSIVCIVWLIYMRLY